MANLSHLWEHQQQAYEFISSRCCSWLQMEAGTGKTLPVLLWIANGAPGFYLAVSKHDQMYIWVDQIKEHGIDLDYVVLDRSTSEQKALQVGRLPKSPDKPLLIISNYESVWRGELFKALSRLSYHAIVADESQKLKSHTAKVNKGMSALADRAKHRIAMTGTPYPNSELDAYGQMRFIDKNAFTSKWKQFLNQFAVMFSLPGNPYVQVIKGAKNVDELKRKIEPYVFSVKLDEVRKMPPALHIQRYVELEKPARHMYDSFERDLFVAIQDTIGSMHVGDVIDRKLFITSNVVSADNVLVQMVRLQQFTSGFIKTDDGKLHTVSDAKIKGLLSIADELGNAPFLVWANFTHEIANIRDALTSAGVTSSELSGNAKEHYAWMEGATQALVIQMQTGSEGFTFTRARHNIYMSIGFNGGNYQQSLARTRRPGADVDKPVIYYYLLARKTIDEDIYDSHGDKIKLSANLTGRMPTHSPTDRK